MSFSKTRRLELLPVHGFSQVQRPVVASQVLNGHDLPLSARPRIGDLSSGRETITTMAVGKIILQVDLARIHVDETTLETAHHLLHKVLRHFCNTLISIVRCLSLCLPDHGMRNLALSVEGPDQP